MRYKTFITLSIKTVIGYIIKAYFELMFNDLDLTPPHNHHVNEMFADQFKSNSRRIRTGYFLMSALISVAGAAWQSG